MTGSLGGSASGRGALGADLTFGTTAAAGAGVGALIGGKYKLVERIGQGGMGAVFAARNTLTGKRVAIKWLLPEHATSVTRERLLREAQLALAHAEGARLPGG